MFVFFFLWFQVIGWSFTGQRYCMRLQFFATLFRSPLFTTDPLKFDAAHLTGVCVFFFGVSAIRLRDLCNACIYMNDFIWFVVENKDINNTNKMDFKLLERRISCNETKTERKSFGFIKNFFTSIQQNKSFPCSEAVWVFFPVWQLLLKIIYSFAIGFLAKKILNRFWLM